MTSNSTPADILSSQQSSDTVSSAMQQIHGLARMIWKRRWSALTFLLLVMTIVSVYTFSEKPVYKATTLLRINKDDLKVLSMQEFVAADENTDELIKTEVEVLHSRNLAEKVADVLNLAADADFQCELQPGFPYSMAAHLRGSGPRENLTDEQRRDAVVERLLGMLNVDPIRGSRLVKLSTYSHSNKLAAEIANTWADIYIRKSVEKKLDASRYAGQMLTRQIAEQKAHVEDAERKLHTYTREQGIYSFDDMKANINQRLTELNSLLTAAEADRIAKQVAYESIKANPRSTRAAMADPVVQRLGEEVVKLEAEYSDLLKVYKPEFPDCQRLRARIERIEAAINQHADSYVQATAVEYTAAVQRVDALKKELAARQEEAVKLQDAAVDYNILNRELDTSTEHLQSLLSRSKEAISSMQIKASKVSVVDPARVPAQPYSPRKALNLALALIVGTALACGSCVMLEYMDTSVRTPEDVERDVGESLLGVVPEIEEEDEVGADNKDLICHLDTKSTISEAYRAIRTSLAFASAKGEARNIVISSAMPGEGKTITAINIATVLGQMGENVLLIDADMRRPRLHRSLRLPNNRGLSTYLVGRCNLPDVVTPTCIPNVDVIVSGPMPPNPSELINSDRMGQLMEECKKNYDRAIIDTPPVMAVTDSRLAAAKADGLIHVIHAGRTDKKCARLAKRHFDSVGANVIGAVLNNVESDHESSYYYYRRAYEN